MVTKDSLRGAMQDRVREILLSPGEREVNITVDQLIGKTGLNYSQVYQTLYRLERLGEIELIREDESAQRSPVVGVKLLRMAPISGISARNEDRLVETKISQDARKMSMTVPHVLEYINQRLAIEKARAAVMEANMNPEEVMSFTPNPLGEEAIQLLQALTERNRENLLLKNDLEAERQNAETYKTRLATRTFDDSGT